MKAFISKDSSVLTAEDTIIFDQHITQMNKDRLRILAIVALIIEPIITTLIYFNVVTPTPIIHRVNIIIFCLAVILLCSTYFAKDNIKTIRTIEFSVINTTILSSVVLTFLRFQQGNHDVSLYLVVIYALSIFIITKPRRALIRYSASLGLLGFLILYYAVNNIHISIFINTISFIIVAVICSSVLYNEQRKLFIEKNEVNRMNEKLDHLSNTDQLTGLFNRRKIDHVVKDAFSNANSGRISVILIDLDYFKKVNDTYGHQIGDEVLKEFSDIVSDNLRDMDLAGRWGGEEFIIISKSTTIMEATSIAKRLKEKVSRYTFIKDIKMTISIGVSSNDNCINTDTLIQQADKALYQAKEKGRDRVEVYTD